MINSLIIFAFQPSLGMSDKVTETLVVISATVVSLTVLYRVSTPFNKMRKILFFLMVAMFFIWYLLYAKLLPVYTDYSK